jgi:predicted RNA binding protein YcfA (HicA-like mRNA interferase family)
MSDIDYSNLGSITARDLVRALLRDGFEFRRKIGSHERYAHQDGRRVTVPYTRRGDTFAIGTLRSIIERQARWTLDDLNRLELLP